MAKFEKTPKKRIWNKPTINPLRLKDTLGKPDPRNVPSEEIGDGFPGVPGKFIDDGPS